MHQTHKILKTMLKEQTCLFEKAETFQILFLQKNPENQTLFFFSPLLRLHSLLLCHTPVGPHLIGKVTAGISSVL